MKISSRVDYALSCVINLACRYPDKKPVTAREIAKEECIETDYAEQLLVSMKRAGILQSIRGKIGGYILAHPPQKITAQRVMESIENEILESICDRKKGRRNKCAHYNDCLVKELWTGLRGNMESYLNKFSLDKLVNLRKKERSYNVYKKMDAQSGSAL